MEYQFDEVGAILQSNADKGFHDVFASSMSTRSFHHTWLQCIGLVQKLAVRTCSIDRVLVNDRYLSDPKGGAKLNPSGLLGSYIVHCNLYWQQPIPPLAHALDRNLYFSFSKWMEHGSTSRNAISFFVQGSMYLYQWDIGNSQWVDHLFTCFFPGVQAEILATTFQDWREIGVHTLVVWLARKMVLLNVSTNVHDGFLYLQFNCENLVSLLVGPVCQNSKWLI